MKIVEKRQLTIQNLMHEFDGFVYIEIWHNNRLHDNYFAFSGQVYPNGQVKAGAKKFFYSPYSLDEIQKEVVPVKNIESFNYFDKLYSINEEGEVIRIDGTPALKCDYRL